MTHEDIKKEVDKLIKENSNPDLTSVQESCEKLGHIPDIDFATTGYNICEICLKLI